MSLLNAASTGASDSIGAYVLSDSAGSFSIPTFTCTSNSQLYLYSLGGNTGAGPNAAAGLMAVLGACPSSGSFLSSLPTVSLNEVTTIAAAFALAGFAKDATHVSSSGMALAQTGVANAFLNAANLASVATGQALPMIPSGNARAPQAKVNALANILATCVSSSSASSASCSSLFADALSGGATGNAPTNTANAAINIAHNPSANVRTLFDLVTTTGSFPLASQVHLEILCLGSTSSRPNWGLLVASQLMRQEQCGSSIKPASPSCPAWVPSFLHRTASRVAV